MIDHNLLYLKVLRFTFNQYSYVKEYSPNLGVTQTAAGVRDAQEWMIST